MCRYDRAGEDEDPAHEHADFGFVTLERPYTLRSFAAYADWVKALHFSNPPPKVGPVTCWNHGVKGHSAVWLGNTIYAALREL